MQSQCLDLSQSISPEISFWYHRHGIHMGDFYLQVNDDYGWVNVDSLKSDQHPRGTAPWNNRVVSLAQYAGDFVRVRFLSFQGNGTASNMAVDDIAIYDVPPLDLAPDSLCSPTEDITSCYLVNQTVDVRVKNNGADSLDFTQDTLNITVFIDKEGQPWDTLYRTLTTNEWVDENSGLRRPLPKDSTVCILMDGTFDMYDIGKTFSFHVKLENKDDLINSNDSASYDVFTREEGGNITQILPTDEVCSGDAVQLTLENYFGRLSWQEYTVNSNGSGFWIPGFSPASNPTYVSNPDTLTYYRVWVCNNVYSDTVAVKGIRPYAIDTVRASKCAGDTRDLTFTLQVPLNIDSVFIYKEDVRSIFNNPNNPIIDSADQKDNRKDYARFLGNADFDPNVSSPVLFDSSTAILSPIGAVNNDFAQGYVPDANGNITLTYINRLAYERANGQRRLDTAFSDTLWLETAQTIGSNRPTNDSVCYSLINIPIIITIEPAPSLGNLQIPNSPEDPARKPILDTLCSRDTAETELLNAGARVGFVYTYLWEVIKYENPSIDSNGVLNPGNPVDTLFDSTQNVLQTYIVDPWELEKGFLYSYQVTVNTPNGCGFINGQSAIHYRYIDNKCFVGLEERALSETIEIYPNPTSEFIFIRYRTQESLKGDITLRDINGRLILEENDVNLEQSTKKIDLNALPKGVYFIQINTPKGRVVEKIVKS